MSLSPNISDREQAKFNDSNEVMVSLATGSNSPLYTTLVDSATGERAEINSSGQLKVVLDGKVSGENSTKETLLSGEVFQGQAVDTLDYSIIFITVFSDKDSAIDGLCTEVSSDGVTWRDGDCYTVDGNTEKTFSFQPNKKLFRVKYKNGPDDQGEFDLQTIFKKTNSKPSSHRIQDLITNDDDATLVKSVLTAKKDDGVFTNIGATASSNLRVTDAESGLAIAKGDVTNTTFVHKFGAAPDFDESDGSVTVWDGADNDHIDLMRYVYSTTAAINSVSSSSIADAQILKIQGLDANYDLVTQEATLDGQNRVALITPLVRIFRMKNDNGDDNVGHIYAYENTALTAGTPTDNTKVRCVIQPNNNQTLMAIYTIPRGYTGYMRDWYASTAGANKDSSYVIELRAREQGGVFQLKHVTSLQDGGTSYIKHNYTEPEVFGEMVDVEMRAKMNVNTTGATIAAGFDIVLIKNDI